MYSNFFRALPLKTAAWNKADKSSETKTVNLAWEELNSEPSHCQQNIYSFWTSYAPSCCSFGGYFKWMKFGKFGWTFWLYSNDILPGKYWRHKMPLGLPVVRIMALNSAFSSQINIVFTFWLIARCSTLVFNYSNEKNNLLSFNYWALSNLAVNQNPPLLSFLLSCRLFCFWQWPSWWWWNNH